MFNHLNPEQHITINGIGVTVVVHAHTKQYAVVYNQTTKCAEYWNNKLVVFENKNVYIGGVAFSCNVWYNASSPETEELKQYIKHLVSGFI